MTCFENWLERPSRTELVIPIKHVHDIADNVQYNGKPVGFCFHKLSTGPIPGPFSEGDHPPTPWIILRYHVAKEFEDNKKYLDGYGWETLWSLRVDYKIKTPDLPH
jgi:hypothetical protein